MIYFVQAGSSHGPIKIGYVESPGMIYQRLRLMAPDPRSPSLDAAVEPRRAVQCPGCWSVNVTHVPEGGLECDCGEALAVIDLRAAPTEFLRGDEEMGTEESRVHKRKAKREAAQHRDETAGAFQSVRVVPESRALAAEREAERLREALEFYGDKKNWTGATSWGGRIFDDEGAACHDSGRAARAALADQAGEQGQR